MRRCTVLVVDDDPAIRSAVSVTLGAHGYRVRVAEDGVEALERVREEIPGLILLDIMMPRLGGWEVKQRLNEDPATAAVPVVAITALADAEARSRSGELRFAAHLEKPFRFDQLLSIVKTLTAA